MRRARTRLVDHVEENLLDLRAEMHTDPANELAAERHAFLEAVPDRFPDEWLGRA